MNHKKKLLATSIIAILFGTAHSNDYISIISQEKHVYDVVENSLPIASEWFDIGTEFNCVEEFSAYDFPLNETFTQNENCLQKQERTVTTTEVFNGAPRTTVVKENQNIPVIISYIETGKENYNTGSQRIQYSLWLDEGIHYACTDFIPLVSSVNLGESFNQNRDCSQDQNRTETIYDIWADGTETIDSTKTESKTIIENETQTILGTYVAATCLDLLNDGNTVSGTYTINPTGNQNITTYCDMTTDGGGWSLVFYSNASSVDRTILSAGDWNVGNSINFSYLHSFKDIERNGKYEFFIHDSSTIFRNAIFTQTNSYLENPVGNNYTQTGGNLYYSSQTVVPSGSEHLDWKGLAIGSFGNVAHQNNCSLSMSYEGHSWTYCLQDQLNTNYNTGPWFYDSTLGGYDEGSQQWVKVYQR